MTELEGGWWEGADAAASPGTRYGFAIDGGETRPDSSFMSCTSGPSQPKAPSTV